MKATRRIAKAATTALLSRRTVQLLAFDLQKVPVRLRTHLMRRQKHPVPMRLHIGCGRRRVPGWINVDVKESDCNLDVSCGRLPWADSVCDVVVAQQVIEHIELAEEFIPLLKELVRICKPGAKLWLSTPDIKKIVTSYVEKGCTDLIRDRQSRFPQFAVNGPPQQMMNVLFHQGGEHKNLFDVDILTWALEEGGWSQVRSTSEREFLREYPDFPVRNDEYVTLWTCATNTKQGG